MKNPILTDIYKNWAEIGRFKSREELQLDLELYKKLLDIVQVGDSYYFLYDPFLRKMEMTSAMVEKVVGIRPDELDVDYLMNNIHPEDLPVFGDFEATVVEFKKALPIDKLTKYKSRYNYRFRTKRGDYVHILQQSITVLADEDGTILRNLVIHTDISEIAPFQRMKLSFIGLDGEPSFVDVKPRMLFSKTKAIFSKSELEVLKLMVQGLNSESIANQLFRSIHTIRNHRKNILRKSGCLNVQELLVKSVKEDWV